MSTSISRSLGCATGLAVALGACSAPSAPPSPPRPTPSLPVAAGEEGATSTLEDQAAADEGMACTEIGNAESVGVDLVDVLDLEGGDYFAQVSVPALGASEITGFAGNDDYYPGGGVQVNLDGEPVTVELVVRDESGRAVYIARDLATPQSFQPNGARWDGENYSLSLLATTSGRLVAFPPRLKGPRLDARGRESVAIYTGCGVERADMVEGSYARVGGVLGGSDGPPPGWNAPYQRGWATRSGDEIA